MAAATQSTPDAGPPLVRVRELSARYGHVAALRGVDLDVHEHEVIGIAGDNGAGKSTLLRCMHGDLDESSGEVWFEGRRIRPHAAPTGQARIGVVWQHLVLPDNLDVAAALMLGKERRRLLHGRARLHTQAREVLGDLDIAITDTTRPVRALTAGERQLLSIARAAWPRPRLLLLDEPTAVLSRDDSAHVEMLIRRFRDEGATIALVSHDVEQLCRLADRIVVMRKGQVVAQVDPQRSHPDELLALMAGHDVSAAPRRQLSRLHGLAGRLTSAEAPDGLALILSTLRAALGATAVSLHLCEGATLRCAGSVGLTPLLEEALRSVPAYARHGPLTAAALEGVTVDAQVPGSRMLRPYVRLLEESEIGSWWAVPFSAGADLSAVISIFRPGPGSPARDDLDLVNLYAGYAASALERERLVAETAARNAVLETIRTVLQTLAGPGRIMDAVQTVLTTLRESTGADEIGLYERDGDRTTCLAHAGPPDASGSTAWHDAAPAAGELPADDGAQVEFATESGSRLHTRLSVGIVLVARWGTRRAASDERALLEDAGHSIRLALERDRAEEARHEMAALRRSQEMQRQFLARLSHELRTPLTAIRGYASSLMQTDVTWDTASQQRFLGRISSESARLRRLVDDLLDFSLIESGVLRLRPDWVDLPLVIDAARSCLPPASAKQVEVRCAPDVPVIWADHDRLEQMIMNLLDNATHHNPPGTAVLVDVRVDGRASVLIRVSDDGQGMPDGAERRDDDRRRSDGPTAGAGLGLSITRGIVAAHLGVMTQESTHPGTRFTIRLPIEEAVPAVEVADD